MSPKWKVKIVGPFWLYAFAGDGGKGGDGGQGIDGDDEGEDASGGMGGKGGTAFVDHSSSSGTAQFKPGWSRGGNGGDGGLGGIGTSSAFDDDPNDSFGFKFAIDNADPIALTGSGIFLTSVPEPTGIWLATLSMIAMFSQRRRT